MTLLKTLVFTLLVPGTVAGVVPWWIAGGAPRDPATAWWRLALGLPLLAAGVATYTWCAWDFATAGRGTPSPTDPPRALVARGLYRWSRNPMYVGVLLVVAGQAARLASAGVLLYAVLLAAAFHARVVWGEEPVLRRSFGAAYERYAAEVPRWLGRRGRGGHA